MIRITRRRSRRERWCESDYGHNRRISEGEVYATVTVSPGDVEIGTGEWYSYPLCAECAGGPTIAVEGAS
jgi:hypothetical protein